MLYKFVLTLFRSSHWRFFIKEAVLKNFAIFTLETPVLESLFDKAAGRQVFSCDYCEIFKDTNFEEHLRTAASVY